jgi:beta-phosphoglucomutase family hydrolase
MIALPENIKGLIFDLDGTLADTMPLHLAAWLAAGRQFGVEITPFMINAMAGIPTIQTVVKLNENYGWELEPLEVKKFKDFHYRKIKVKAGKEQAIIPVLKIAEKYKNQLPLAIGTGSARLNALETLRELEIIDWFEAVVSAEDVERHKPFPDTFLKCAELISVPPENCMVFEDGDLGILAAKNAGMQVMDVRELYSKMKSN